MLNLENKFNQAWYQGSMWTLVLFPLAWFYQWVLWLRKLCYHTGLFSSEHPQIPVIIVGNISIGGTGKTPVVVALARHLQKKGHHVGILSRGYGGNEEIFPCLVTEKSEAARVGDEPCLLAQSVNAKVVIDPVRIRGARYLKQLGCDLIISDDGLQHYALKRDIEIVVVDGDRGFGNKHLLPVGPLRESISRLKNVDYVLINGNKPLFTPSHLFDLQPLDLFSIDNKHQPGLDWLENRKVHACVGIGNPKRFFKTLKQLGALALEHSFPDHHVFQKDDFPVDDLPIIVTEKDAVKMKQLKLKNCYYLKVSANLPNEFFQQLDFQLKKSQLKKVN